MKDRATRDFEKWSGQLFKAKPEPPKPRTESRYGKPQHTAAENRNTTATENRSTSGNKRYGKPQHMNGNRRYGKPQHI
jgi:hypothetical protein